MASTNAKRLIDKKVMQSFPKVELHRHLEGTMPIYKLYEFSRKNNLKLPHDFEAFKREVQFPKDSNPDFLAFLAKFRNNWYKSYEDIYEIAYHSVKELKNDGIYYIELRFSPEHYALENNFDREEVTKLITQAGDKAAKETGILLKYLITFNRNKQTQDEMIELYNKIKKLNIKNIVGIDLAGDEINYPPKNFTQFFRQVYNDGLYKATIHAGEVSPPEQIWEAVLQLYASRIGHGVSAIKDKKLQKYLIEKKIALEQCITSNYQTGAWHDEHHHPLAELYKNKVCVTINSDDPMIQDTDLTDDYIKTIKFFEFSYTDLYNLNINAINASFLNDSEKTKLLHSYQKVYDTFMKKNGTSL